MPSSEEPDGGLLHDATVDQDSRGILAPSVLRERTVFTRYAPGRALTGLVDWFWCVRWDLPGGTEHRQPVLQHPAVNLTVATPDARTGRSDVEALVTGTATRLVDRVLAGRGWAVGFKTTVGGMSAFVECPVGDLVDRVVEADVVLGVDGPTLVRDLIDAGRETDAPERGPDGEPGPHDAEREPLRVALLTLALERSLDLGDRERIRQAREVAAIARIAETDRTVRRLDDLASRAGVGSRALQRMFARTAGVSPTWVLRRYRLIEAAERVRHGERVAWGEVAAELGYADQAHLVRDFRRAIGRTPEAYARSLR